MKILLISGHGAGDSGAVGCGYKEADLTREATNILAGKLNAYDVSITRYPTARDAYQDNRNGRLATPFSAYNLVVEVHFNSFNGDAHGTEVLYRENNSKTLASKVSSAIASVSFANRGAKYRTNLANMNACYRLNVPYILIETCFIDYSVDMKFYKLHEYDVWGKVASTICSYYGVGKLASSGESIKPSKPTPVQSKSEKITVDGWWGQATTRLAQKVLGTTIDGIVSNQPMANKKRLPNCSTYSWEFKASGYGAGSSMVRALQRMVKADADGYCGPMTVKALQKFLGVDTDGYCGPATVKAWQRWLNTKVK